MDLSDLNASMPGLPPKERLRQGDRVRCIRGLKGVLKAGELYTVDADYGDVKGEQLVFLEGFTDNCPFAADRFERVLTARPTGDEPCGNPAAEFAELGMLAVSVPEEPIKLSLSEQAALENTLATERHFGPLPADNVNLPKHYARFKIEPIRFICENGLNFFQGNIVKYILRHDAKNGMEDLKKAKRYLEMFIKFVSGDPDWWKVMA